jgi:hypothetical protein
MDDDHSTIGGQQARSASAMKPKSGTTPVPTLTTDRDDQQGKRSRIGRHSKLRRRIGHVPGADLVEATEILDICGEDRRRRIYTNF